MDIKEKTEKNFKVLEIDGRIDSTTAPQFETSLMTLVNAGKTQIIVDFSKVDYISSAGLRIVLMGAKALKSSGGDFMLCGLSDKIKEVFEISGFLPILKIKKSLKEALS